MIVRFIAKTAKRAWLAARRHAIRTLGADAPEFRHEETGTYVYVEHERGRGAALVGPGAWINGIAMPHAGDTEGLDDSFPCGVLEHVVREAVHRVAHGRLRLHAVNIGPLHHLLAGIDWAHCGIAASMPDRDCRKRSAVTRSLADEIAEFGSRKPVCSR